MVQYTQDLGAPVFREDLGSLKRLKKKRKEKKIVECFEAIKLIRVNTSVWSESAGSA